LKASYYSTVGLSVDLRRSELSVCCVGEGGVTGASVARAYLEAGTYFLYRVWSIMRSI